MTCPNCDVASTDPATVIAESGAVLTVCQNPKCARTLVSPFAGMSFQIAGADDVMALSEGERQTLRQMRPKAWRDDVKARSTAIRGR